MKPLFEAAASARKSMNDAQDIYLAAGHEFTRLTTEYSDAAKELRTAFDRVSSQFMLEVNRK